MRNRFLIKLLMFINIVTIISLLIGCTVHCIKDISERLDVDELNQSYNVIPADLSLNSKCVKRPSVRIVNLENRVEDFVVLENPPWTGVVSPKDMMDSIRSYLGKSFNESKINLDENSSKLIQIKLIDLKSIAGVWSFGSYFKMELSIPEIGYKKIYESKDNAVYGYTAHAYAIHGVARQVIDDKSIQNYILCRAAETTAPSNNLSQKLKELQDAFNQGLITKDEYQNKRKAILETH